VVLAEIESVYLHIDSELAEVSQVYYLTGGILTCSAHV
jgi:hypothetical protein